MKKYFLFPALALAGGAAAFALRRLQIATGFESATGLPAAGCPYAAALPILLCVLAAVFWLMDRRLPGEKGGDSPLEFAACFASSGAGIPTLMVMGLFLWLASGAYGVYTGVVLGPSVLNLVLGILTILSAAALFPVVSACRKRGSETGSGVNENLLLVPVVCLVVRLVLTYRADSVNPTLAAYYVELLALVFLVLCLYRVSAFAFRCGRTRRFAFCAQMAVVFCMATMADLHGAAARLLYAGGALLVLAFLLLRLETVAWAEAPAAGE